MVLYSYNLKTHEFKEWQIIKRDLYGYGTVTVDLWIGDQGTALFKQRINKKVRSWLDLEGKTAYGFTSGGLIRYLMRYREEINSILNGEDIQLQ